MKKKITIIGINYYPEDTAIGLYTYQLSEFFINNGIDVSIITGFPYYPAWRIKEDYQNKPKYYFENINGIKVYRYKQYVPNNPTFLKRIYHLLDFCIGTFYNCKRIKETDIVLCIIPFIGSVYFGKLLANKTRSKLWVHIQDFEFDAVTDSNIIVNKKKYNFIFKLLFWIEKRLLNKAAIISTISNSMLLKLKKKNTNYQIGKHMLPNWVDINFINPHTSNTHRYLKSLKFKILYSGNIGEKQDWDFFIEFTKSLVKFADIEIIVVGNGSKRTWLEEQLLDFNNIYFYNPVDYSELSDLLCSADLHILFQKINVIDTVMPSKILAMMSSKKPSLITGNLKSEVATIINKSKSGKYFETNSVDELIDFVLKIKMDKELQEVFGSNARNYVEANFSKDLILNQFKNVFFNLSEN